MKRLSVCAAACLVLVLPILAYAYTIDVEIGESGVERFGSSVGAVGDEVLGDRIYETRLVPPGYEVVGYEVLWEQWSELGVDEGTFAESDVVGGVEAVGSGSLLGYGVVNMVVNPVRTDGGRVSVLRGLRVRVECEALEGGLRVHRRSELTDRHLDEVVGRALGVDVSDYGDWSLEGYRDWTSESPGLDGGVVDCIIISPDELVEDYERLASWHDGMGVRTVIRGLSWIYANYSGSDEAERVRNFIRDAYEHWGTVYVLLGGDGTVVPLRYAWTNHYGGESIPADIYFANLEGTWNENGNNIFGEWGNSPDNPGDGVTFFQQVMVGRLPVRTETEAIDCIDKIIAYTTTPAPGWASKTLLLGEVIFPVDWKPGDPITLNGRDICDAAAAYFPAHIDTAARYQELGTMNRVICLRELSLGHNFVILAGHGDAFRTSTGEGDPPFIFNSDFDTLSNYNEYSFFYALNCNNSAVDVDCVFRHFVINPAGGGIGTYASTRYDFPNVGQYFLNAFCDYAYQRGITRLGDLCGLHHHQFVPSARAMDGSVRWTVLTYMLLGDPVIYFWVDEPDTFDVLDAGTMVLGDSTYSVSVSDGGSPVEGAVVVLRGERGEYGSGLTDAGGMALLEYRPRGGGYAELFVSGQGYLVYQDSVEVTGSGVRCYVSGSYIDDGFGWVGNGDGEAGWGERVGLGVGLVNGGLGSASGVLGTVSAIEGCSVFVDVELDGSYQDSLMYLGRDRRHPETMPFGVVVGDEVLGRSRWDLGEEEGCWLWVDGMGWHLRVLGTGDSLLAYRCSLEVHGEIRGYKPVSVEADDGLVVGGDYIVLEGEVLVGDYEDGFDFLSGAGMGVVLHDSSESYGSVGSEEVVRYYDVEFTGVTGDRVGAWFEIEIEDDGSGLWYDWFRVLVHDGILDGERVELQGLVGDSLGVVYGVRNVGSGGLKGIVGTLRGISGVLVEDSLSVYGDLGSRGYGEGDGYVVRMTGGDIEFEVELVDAYGREWVERVEVRDPVGASGLRYICGSDYLELWWSSGGDSLFLGYDIYRSEDYGGPYVLAGMVDGYARYVDGGLLSEEDYYYYICVRDSMGNVSAASETLEAWTGSPYQAGWPVGPGNVMYSSVCAEDLDGDGTLEVVVGSKSEEVDVWEHDGSVRTGWPRAASGEVWSSPAVVNIDGDPELEIIVGSDDGNLYVWNHDGTGVLNADGRFRMMGGLVKSAPTVDDIDDDVDMEILVANTYGQVYCWHHDGTGYIQPNGMWADLPGSIYGSITVADLDGDDSLEVIVGSTDGNIYVWNSDGTGYLSPDGLFASPGALYCSIAAGDIDGDSDLELAVGGMWAQSVRVYENNGSLSSGWPASVIGYVRSSPALAELDGDGRLDVVFGTTRVSAAVDSGHVYVLDHSGDVRPGWPQGSTGNFESSPVVGDIDGDGQPEIVIGCTDNFIHAWHKDGTPVKGWPRYVGHEVYSTPMLCDLDGDGDVEVVACAYDGLVHVYDVSAAYDEDTMEWPKYCHDAYNSGLYGGPSKAGVQEDEPGRLPATFVLMAYPSPAASRATVRLGVPSTGAGAFRVDVFDVRGRLVRNLVDGELDAGYHNTHWDCDDGGGRRVSSGIYFIKVSGRNANLTKKLVVVR